MTNVESIQEMMVDVRNTGYGHCEVVNYTKSGTPYLANIKVKPVLAKSSTQEQYISHYFGVISVSHVDDEKKTIARYVA